MLIVPEFFLRLPQQLGGLHHILFIPMFFKPGSYQTGKVSVLVPVDAPRLHVAEGSFIKPQHLLLVGQVGGGGQHRHDCPLTFSGREGSRETGGRKLGGGPAGGHFRFRRGGLQLQS